MDKNPECKNAQNSQSTNLRMNRTPKRENRQNCQRIITSNKNPKRENRQNSQLTNTRMKRTPKCENGQNSQRIITRMDKTPQRENGKINKEQTPE